MKYLKTYENNKNIRVDDFVQIKTNKKYNGFYHPEKILNFVNNTIGQISSIEHREFIVRYITDTNIQFFRFNENEILAIGKTKEEVEQKLALNKYNL